jgi:prepilin-type N-terminal cleavage/methylation domain-containing protein
MPLSPRTPPLADPRAGFTLIEVMVVAMIVVALTSVALAANRESPHRLVYHQAQQLRAAMTQAVQEAEARGGDALLVASAAAVGDTGGLFLAFPAAAGATEADTAGRTWAALRDGSQWGAGTAVLGPLGDAAGTGAVPRVVRCTAGRGCAVGVTGVLTYYVTHARDATAVAAVVLTPDGIAHLYRYVPAQAVWTTEAPR